MSIHATPGLQRIFDKAIPARCKDCGMLIAWVPNRNGLQRKCDIDDNSNPTNIAHSCPMTPIKNKIKKSFAKVKPS